MVHKGAQSIPMNIKVDINLSERYKLPFLEGLQLLELDNL